MPREPNIYQCFVLFTLSSSPLVHSGCCVQFGLPWVVAVVDSWQEGGTKLLLGKSGYLQGGDQRQVKRGFTVLEDVKMWSRGGNVKIDRQLGAEQGFGSNWPIIDVWTEQQSWSSSSPRLTCVHWKWSRSCGRGEGERVRWAKGAAGRAVHWRGLHTIRRLK